MSPARPSVTAWPMASMVGSGLAVGGQVRPWQRVAARLACLRSPRGPLPPGTRSSESRRPGLAAADDMGTPRGRRTAHSGHRRHPTTDPRGHGLRGSIGNRPPRVRRPDGGHDLATTDERTLRDVPPAQAWDVRDGVGRDRRAPIRERRFTGGVAGGTARTPTANRLRPATGMGGPVDVRAGGGRVVEAVLIAGRHAGGAARGAPAGSASDGQSSLPRLRDAVHRGVGSRMGGCVRVAGGWLPLTLGGRSRSWAWRTAGWP